MSENMGVVGVDVIRFRGVDGKTVAVLATSGRLALKDERGNAEFFNSWRDFVKTVMGEIPVKKTDPQDPEVLEQLGIGLQARAEKIERKEESTVKKAGTKPAKAKAEAKDPKVKAEPKECPLCLCGCGEQVGKPTSRFIPGHDAKFHSMLKRYERGELTASELPAPVRKFADDNGIKPSAKAKKEPKAPKSKEK